MLSFPTFVVYTKLRFFLLFIHPPAAKSPHINVRWGWVSKFLHFCYCFIVWLAMISFNPNVFWPFDCAWRYARSSTLNFSAFSCASRINEQRARTKLFVDRTKLFDSTVVRFSIPMEGKILPEAIVDYFPSSLWKACLYRDHVLSFHIVKLWHWTWNRASKRWLEDVTGMGRGRQRD